MEALSPADKPAEGQNHLHEDTAEKKPSFALKVHLLTRPPQATMTAHDPLTLSSIYQCLLIAKGAHPLLKV